MAAAPADAIVPGRSAGITRTITADDVEGFARVTGDRNPVHLDEEWARRSVFGTRVAHGMLTAGLVSAVIGTELPGPGTVYLSQTLRWIAPVHPGDTVTATVTVRDVDAVRRRVVLDTVVTRDGEVVLSGEALVIPPSP